MLEYFYPCGIIILKINYTGMSIFIFVLNPKWNLIQLNLFIFLQIVKSNFIAWAKTSY